VTRDPLAGLLEDFESYAQAFLVIRDKAAREVPLRLNPVQRRLWAVKKRAYAEGKPRRFIILKARREGITTFEMAHSFWACATKPSQRVLMLGHEDKATEMMFRIATLFYERLPSEIRPRRLTQSNKRDINLVGLRSLLSMGTAGSPAVGRGDTLSKFHWAEVAWSCKQDKETQRRLLSGLTEAASHGEAVLESTPNGVGDLFEEKFSEAWSGRGEWTPLFFTWWDDPTHALEISGEEAEDLRSSLTDEETALARRARLSLGQLAWRRAKVLELGRLFPQEYPEDPRTCFLMSGSCYFNREWIERTIQALPDHAEEGWVEFAPPVPGRKYVVGADASEGIAGGDYCVAKVIDAESEQEMGLLRTRLTPEDFARELVRIALRYNTALIVPERNNHGHSVINTLVNQLDYQNLYHYLDYDPVLRRSVPKTGWETSGKTRPVMLSALREHAEKGWLRVADKVLLAEMRQFGPNATTGKIEALNDGHDDDIMATAMAIMGREQALGQMSMPSAESARSAQAQTVAGAGRMFAPVSVAGTTDRRIF
jgi:hypothetical protein